MKYIIQNPGNYQIILDLHSEIIKNWLDESIGAQIFQANLVLESAIMVLEQEKQTRIYAQVDTTGESSRTKQRGLVLDSLGYCHYASIITEPETTLSNKNGKYREFTNKGLIWIDHTDLDKVAFWVKERIAPKQMALAEAGWRYEDDWVPLVGCDAYYLQMLADEVNKTFETQTVSVRIGQWPFRCLVCEQPPENEDK